MAKEIQYDVEARGALKNGVDKLANAVKVTFCLLYTSPSPRD